MSRRIKNETDPIPQPPANYHQVDPDLTSPPARKRRHVFRWVFLGVQALFLVWVISGASSGSSHPPACSGLTGQNMQTCINAGHAGTAIGVAVIIVLWAAVDLILALTWAIFRKRA